MNQFKKGIFYGRTCGRNKKIRERLVEEYGICFWCKRPVNIYIREKGITTPDDEATLDHLKSRNNGRELGENTPKVLACRKCNEEREYK